MVLDNNDVPCLEVGAFVIDGYDLVSAGIRKVKKGRGYTEEEVFEKKPRYKQEIKLVPAVEMGWSETVIYEYKVRNQRFGRIELHQVRYTRDRWVCPKCGTNRYTLLKLIGWRPSEYHIPVLGSGVFRRCFKCDITVGGYQQGDMGESTVLKTDIPLMEAKDVIAKYGQEIKL